MRCTRPLLAIHDGFHPSGKKKFRFLKAKFVKALSPIEVANLTFIPCGRCIHCRIDKSSEWSVRCVHEAMMHKYTSFVTLTYSDDNLPKDGSVHRKHVTKFIKRLRSHVKTQEFAMVHGFAPGYIRYFFCGEYGGKTARPHYHGILFGVDFFDKKYLFSRSGRSQYTSPTLEKVWGLGNVNVGTCTPDSIQYCAMYSMKKVFGEKSKKHYQLLGKVTEHNIDENGEIIPKNIEFLAMSTDPGIGAEFYKMYTDSMYPKGMLINSKGREVRTPRYYDKLHERVKPHEMEHIRAERARIVKESSKEVTPQSLLAAEETTNSRLALFNRRDRND